MRTDAGLSARTAQRLDERQLLVGASAGRHRLGRPSRHGRRQQLRLPRRVIHNEGRYYRSGSERRFAFVRLRDHTRLRPRALGRVPACRADSTSFDLLPPPFRGGRTMRLRLHEG